MMPTPDPSRCRIFVAIASLLRLYGLRPAWLAVRDHAGIGTRAIGARRWADEEETVFILRDPPRRPAITPNGDVGPQRSKPVVLPGRHYPPHPADYEQTH